MSDTPRTDDAEVLMGGLWYVLSDVARELERELTEARDALVRAHDTMLMVNCSDLGRSDREALDAAREHAKTALRHKS